MTFINNKEQTVVRAESVVLSFLFYEGKFEIPWHQRYYDWDEEHVIELLEDLEEAIVEDRKCYFLGALMLVQKNPQVWEINDGQQRMVTFSLICARLSRLFTNERDAHREALALRIPFVLNENHTRHLSEADELTPRLSPPRNDKSNYYFLIRGHDIGSNGKLGSAWSAIDDYFTSISVDKAKEFFDFVMNKLEVVSIFVPKALDANSVFETLNARGKPLGDLDKIRNHIYSFFGNDEVSRRDTVHDHLESVRQQLREERRKANALEYMRCYLQCRYGFLPKDRLYRDTKAQMKAACSLSMSYTATPEDYVFDLVEDLSDDRKVALFHALSSPSETSDLVTYFLRHSRQGGSRRNLFTFLTELKNYKVTQPIVFALLNRYVQEIDGQGKRSVARFVHTRLKLLTSFVMRTAFVASKFESSRFEGTFSNLAQEVTSTTSIPTVQFQRALLDVDEYEVFDNSIFISTIEQTSIRDNAKARRLLMGLAYSEQSDLSILNDKKYTIEHILPRSDNHLRGWVNFDERDHKDLVSRIGNLTLLANSDNKPGAADNGSFDRKREIFRRSSIQLTREVSEMQSWSPQEIDRRQKRLARLAARVWELPNV